MIKKESSNDLRLRRHTRIRKSISGTAEMPRLNVFRSNKEIYVQVIDDEIGKTVFLTYEEAEAALGGLDRQQA